MGGLGVDATKRIHILLLEIHGRVVYVTKAKAERIPNAEK
jgi:hypothetical protein